MTEVESARETGIQWQGGRTPEGGCDELGLVLDDREADADDCWARETSPKGTSDEEEAQVSESCQDKERVKAYLQRAR